jgi:hypothetical protein
LTSDRLPQSFNPFLVVFRLDQVVNIHTREVNVIGIKFTRFDDYFSLSLRSFDDTQIMYLIQ